MLKATLRVIQGDRATLAFEDGQTFTVPVSEIEGMGKEGQLVAVSLAALGSEDAGRQRLAQDLLNELLKA